MDEPNWLDALSDGNVFRHWLALFGQFFLGMLYFMLIVAGYSASIGLSFILIGIPLLLFTIASTRTLADIDRRLMAAVLDIEAPRTPQDLDLRGENLGTRLGMLLGSGLTWRSLVYLLLKMPIGIITFTASMALLPLMALELDSRAADHRSAAAQRASAALAGAWLLPRRRLDAAD
ncbi:MAG: sensor domain-containing protein [Chloroflexi bacterium]|nr:sensor domain-containing protein [Chloroflexota bacterium]